MEKLAEIGKQPKAYLPEKFGVFLLVWLISIGKHRCSLHLPLSHSPLNFTYQLNHQSWYIQKYFIMLIIQLLYLNAYRVPEMIDSPTILRKLFEDLKKKKKKRLSLWLYLKFYCSAEYTPCCFFIQIPFLALSNC